MRPWQEVLAARADVANGDFSASEFAADLHAVAFPAAAGAGAGPVEHFDRTHLTAGLRRLIELALRRMSGDRNAAPVISLQDGFGGGKTHALLSLWQLFSPALLPDLPADVEELLAGRGVPVDVRRVALVGTHLSPSGTVKPDGTPVATLWGELGWQLGGPAGYAMVARADSTRTNPGQELRDLIAAHSPCLIMIDEWVAYARQLWGREDLPAGTFDTQFSFAQALTEAVTAVPGALLVVSLPAAADPDSAELGGRNGLNALTRLQNVIGRVAEPWQPAASPEFPQIVQRRLFSRPNSEALAEIASVASAFVNLYLASPADFPPEVSSDPAGYRARIEAAFPLHPELLERLQQGFSAVPSFQRTRGLLRLISCVVQASWAAEGAARTPLIMPGTLPLADPRVAAEVTRAVPGPWGAVLTADVDGPASTAARIDAERPALGAGEMTRRLARTIFLGSIAPAEAANRGLDRRRAWLGAALPADAVASFEAALDLLRRRAHYLSTAGERYWFDTRATITRTVAEHADQLRQHPEEAWAEVVSRLSTDQPGYPGGFAGVQVAPGSSAEIPETQDARLVLLHPSLTHRRGSQDSAALRFARDAFQNRGSGPRTNRNLVVFLAPDAARLEEAAATAREYLAWCWVQAHAAQLQLQQQDAERVPEGRDRADRALDARIAQAYHWVLVPEQPEPGAPPVLAVEKADGASPRLAERVSARLSRSGLLSDRIAARSLRMELDGKLAAVWSRGHVSVGELWSYYCRHPYLSRLRDRRALEHGIASVLSLASWESDGFALAEGFEDADAGAAGGGYRSLVLPGPGAVARAAGSILDTTLLVAPAAAGLLAPAAAGSLAPAASRSRALPALPADQPESGRQKTHFAGTMRIDPERHGRDLKRLSQEVLRPLAGTEGARLELSVEVRARASDGFTPETMRAVLENARTLGLELSTFSPED